MSFPSAVKFAETMPPQKALLAAVKTDTPLAWAALTTMAAIVADGRTNRPCPCCTMKNSLAMQGVPREHTLRSEVRGKGVMFDFDPDSPVGRQLARVLGTDVVRPLVAEFFATPGVHDNAPPLYVGLMNCCKVPMSPNPDDTRATPREQIDWQTSIDC